MQIQKVIDKCESLLIGGDFVDRRLSNIEKDLVEIENFLKLRKTDAHKLRLRVEALAMSLIIGEIAQFVKTGRCDSSRLVDGWRLAQLDMRLRESIYLEIASKFDSYSGFLEDHTTSATITYLDYSWSSIGFLLTGKPSEFAKALPFFRLSTIRNDLEDYFDSLSYQFQLALLEFLYAEDENIEKSRISLSEFPPLGFINTAWEDEEAFSEGLMGLLEWHFAECQESLKTGGSYPIEPYAVLPIWILAIERKRCEQGYPSSLPDHPILDRCVEFVNYIKDANSSQFSDKIARHVEDNYKLSDTSELLEFWRRFVLTG